MCMQPYIEPEPEPEEDECSSCCSIEYSDMCLSD